MTGSAPLRYRTREGIAFAQDGNLIHLDGNGAIQTVYRPTWDALFEPIPPEAATPEPNYQTLEREFDRLWFGVGRHIPKDATGWDASWLVAELNEVIAGLRARVAELERQQEDK